MDSPTKLIPPESIQIDVSNYRSLWNHRKSNRFEYREPSEFETPIENKLPVQSGSIEQGVFNTESYRNDLGWRLWNKRASKRQKPSKD